MLTPKRCYVIEQTKEGVVSEHGRAVMEAVLFERWLRGTKHTTYRMQTDTTPIQRDEIPVGSIDWTQAVSGTTIRPMNLPENCCGTLFAPRGPCKRLNRAELEKELKTRPLFVKSDTKAKAWPSMVARSVLEVPIDGRYFCSPVVDFNEEWRIFVFNQEILDVKQYGGSWEQPLTQAEIKYIKQSLLRAAIPLPAYTVDVGRTENGMEWIEVHPFIACGLYGFDSPTEILRMTFAAWKQHLKNSQN